MLAAFAAPVAAKKEEGKVVRVGWYESTYCYIDKFGRRSGIVYEYQQRIAAHTGWTYEYVEDSWPNLLQMLIDGEIDLLSDVSYTAERAESMLYSALAMGAESYFIYIDAENDVINPEDLGTLGGRRIGVNKDTVQEEMLKEWAEKNGIALNVVELTGDESESTAMLERGDIDALVTMDSMGAEVKMIPVCRIGSSDFYFTVNKDRNDLWNELNAAMNSIQDEDPYFNQRMFDEYVHVTKTNAFLLPSLENWLEEHGAIRVGYLENYMPFCAEDKSGGGLTGALRDYLAHASNCMKNANVTFETYPYPSLDDAIGAMKSGEVDCVFPINLSTYDGETRGLLTVSSIMQTEMSVMMEAEDRPDMVPGDNLTVAVNEGNLNFETFIKDQMPEWTIKNYPTIEDCFKAVSDEDADCVLLCDYRMKEYESLTNKYKLVALPTGEMMGLSFAVNRDGRELYSILNKIASLSSNDDMEYSLVSYIQSGKKVTFMEFIEDNWIVVLIIITAVFAALLFLLLQKLGAERDLNERQKQLEESLRRELEHKEQLKSVTEIAYSDTLTGLKNKNSYGEAERELDGRIADRSATEFAVALFRLNDLKAINDSKGHEVGDRYIKESGDLICSRFKRSIIYHIRDDEFVSLLEGYDYDYREMLLRAFSKQMDVNRRRGGFTISFAVAVFDAAHDKNTADVFERAEEQLIKQK